MWLNQDTMNKDDQAKETEKQVRVGTSSEESAKSTEGSKSTEKKTTRSHRRITTNQSAHAGNAAKVKCATSTPIRKVTVQDLKEQLRKLKVPTIGNKPELQRRLAEYGQAHEENDTDSDAEDNTVIANDELQNSDDEI